jgi:Zn ribbon nucleic-acid-binding protein
MDLQTLTMHLYSCVCGTLWRQENYVEKETCVRCGYPAMYHGPRDITVSLKDVPPQDHPKNG